MWKTLQQPFSYWFLWRCYTINNVHRFTDLKAPIMIFHYTGNRYGWNLALHQLIRIPVLMSSHKRSKVWLSHAKTLCFEIPKQTAFFVKCLSKRSLTYKSLMTVRRVSAAGTIVFLGRLIYEDARKVRYFIKIWASWTDQELSCDESTTTFQNSIFMPQLH